jgi:hypothetical protein
MALKLKVFADKDGNTYVKQMSESEVADWLVANPEHTLVR